ncbi:hypothetical protein G7Z17_g2602 [Cylindrodendrum hubeiense]|uniref:F-box domain-containing protein n=1 Tax=Cylindrodendrum hubeiense TaxID=595255 RepID=A0A9P5LBI3_9HYPO|nr:hypothetical protein G7Z17_g2602 [Cylindrodendrum hubeiense]
MYNNSSVTLASLPIEIVTYILSLLPQFALLPLRCANRQLSFIATTFAFRSVRLQAHGSSSAHFISIAKSEKLSPLVREVTCDTWIGPNFEYRAHGDYLILPGFLTALPFLASLRNVKALHLRFHRDCSRLDSYDEAEELPDIRFRILDTIFQSLAGTWSAQRQQEIDQSLQMCPTLYDYKATTFPAPEIASPIALTTLTVSNLADFDDPRVKTSDAFKKVLSSTSLTDLKLFITSETYGDDREWMTENPEKFDMFENLPGTWLSPVAANLTVLSLYFHEYWGWFPKMDFRLVGSLPHLKVLALGKYTFSHEWQVDWMASLGLEELYLDDCYILYQANCPMPMDHTTTVVGQDPKGDDIIISNEGFMRRDIWVSGDNIERIKFPLRWHTIFSRWQESMSTLKVFKFGYGSWEQAPKETRLANYEGNPRKPSNTAVQNHPFEHNAFRYFDCPAPGSKGDKYRKGTGLAKIKNLEFQYLYHETTDWTGWEEWVDIRREDADEGEWELDENLGAKDKAALDLLVSVAEERRITGAISRPL